MIDPNSIQTISDLRFNTKEVFKKAAKSPVFIFQRSSPKGVLLSLEMYERMASDLEDYYDSMKAKEYESQKKNKKDWIPFEEVKKRLKR